MTTKLYVVIGSKGEYSDRDEWVAAVYTDEAVAQAAAEAHLKADKEAEATFLRWMRHDYRAGEGLAPPAGEADDYTVVEAALDEWQGRIWGTNCIGQ